MTCSEVTDELGLLLSHFCELSAGFVSSDVPEPVPFGLTAAQNHSYSHRSQIAGYVQGPHRCSPTQAAKKPTAEDIRIDVCVRCAHDLGSSWQKQQQAQRW